MLAFCFRPCAHRPACLHFAMVQQQRDNEQLVCYYGSPSAEKRFRGRHRGWNAGGYGLRRHRYGGAHFQEFAEQPCGCTHDVINFMSQLRVRHGNGALSYNCCQRIPCFPPGCSCPLRTLAVVSDRHIGWPSRRKLSAGLGCLVDKLSIRLMLELLSSARRDGAGCIV